jgi:hypothetical protein
MAEENAVRFEPAGDAHQVTVAYGEGELVVGKEGHTTSDGGEIAALRSVGGLKESAASGGKGGKG